MTDLLATPRFGGPRNIPSYYENVSAIVLAMRPKFTLRAICYQLNAQNLKTPSGLEWSRTRLANFIHNSIK